MEEIDIVDKNDIVIGWTNKEIAHEVGHIHRVAAAYVFDKKGRLYMQEHLKSAGRFDHSVGGHVMKGENYDDAIKREAYEELGITGEATKVAIFYPQKSLPTSRNLHVYGLYEIVSQEDWEFTPNEEVKKLIPLPLEEIVTLMNQQPKQFVSGFIYTMKKYIQHKKLPYKVTVI